MCQQSPRRSPGVKWRTADRHIGVSTEQVSENYKNKMHKWIKPDVLGKAFLVRNHNLQNHCEIHCKATKDAGRMM